MEPRHAAQDGDYSSYAEFYQDSAYSVFPQEHRSGGSFGLQLMRVDQQPIDFIDPSVPDIVFTRTDTNLNEILFDLGDGIQVDSAQVGTFAYYPAQTEARTQINVPHNITVLALKHHLVADLVASAGGCISSLDRLSGKMSDNVIATSIMDRMWRASLGSGPAMNLYLDGMALQFLAVVADNTSLSPFGADSIEDARIARAIEYLEAHISEPMTVSELASVAALSPSQFARVFKATTGEAAWAFVQRRRVERARDMLRHTTTPISQIAFDCGFASQNHMTNLVRRHLGATPGNIRTAG